MPEQEPERRTNPNNFFAPFTSTLHLLQHVHVRFRLHLQSSPARRLILMSTANAPARAAPANGGPAANEEGGSLRKFWGIAQVRRRHTCTMREFLNSVFAAIPLHVLRHANRCVVLVAVAIDPLSHRQRRSSLHRRPLLRSLQRQRCLVLQVICHK